MKAQARAGDLPSALARGDEIIARLGDKRVAVFLDYDGTLTPIASRPDLAILPQSMRRILKRLAARHCVAVISGRDRPDVEALVGVKGLVYAGSHGFDIAGPDGLRLDHDEARRCLPVLDAAERELRPEIEAVAGALVERKRYSIAVHYRNVAEAETAKVADITGRILGAHAELERAEGKKVHEVRPRLEWDKGRAVLWLLERLGLDRPDVLAIYIGDDRTDEDAFRALANRGIGIIVDPPDRETHAAYTLRDTGEVERFLRRIEAGGAPKQ